MLNSFVRPRELATVGRKLLGQLFGYFKAELAAGNYTLPEPEPGNEEYFNSLAQALEASENLPTTLIEALEELEELALPENGERLRRGLEEAAGKVELDPEDSALRQAIQVWQFRARRPFGEGKGDSAEGQGSGTSTTHPVEMKGETNRDACELPKSGTGEEGRPVARCLGSNSGAIACSGVAAAEGPPPLKGRSGGQAGRAPERGQHAQEVEADVAVWPERVDGAALLDELSQLLSRYVVLPAHAAPTLALWVLHTYAFHLRDVTTYVGIESPEKRCGKTTLLGLLKALANRAVASSNISPPAFFRVIEELSPTLLIDEVDTFIRGNDQLKGILNAGYNRETAFVFRAVAAADSDLEEEAEDENSTAAGAVKKYSYWCPKAMAKIGRFPDTLADRCIIIRMQRKTTAEKCERSRELDTQPLRQQCARFVLDHQGAIAAARPEIPGALNDRAADIWEPLLVLADIAGGHWPEAARQAGVGLSAGSQEQNLTASLLLGIFALFTIEKKERLFTRELVMGLNNFADRPWAEMRQGNPVTDIWLSQVLRPYGIKPRTLWEGGSSAKGYVLKDFAEVFRRYVTRTDLHHYLGEPPPAEEGEKEDATEGTAG